MRILVITSTKKKTVNVKSGMSNVTFGWDEIALTDTLVVTILDPRFPYEVDSAYSVVKRYDVVNDPYLKFAWHLQKSEPEYAKLWNIDIESHINVADLSLKFLPHTVPAWYVVVHGLSTT